MPTGTSDYTFTIEAPPAHYQISYEQTLYHQFDYLKCQLDKPDISFWISQPDSTQIHGVIHFHFEDNKAISQKYAPFGSLNGRHLAKDLIQKFGSFVLDTLFNYGIKEMEINHPSPLYNCGSTWNEVLIDLGFMVKQSINYHLVMDDVKFHKKIHLMEKRKLARCQRFNFEILPIEFLLEIYHFIETCRKEREQTLSMTPERLKEVTDCLPNDFLLCAVSSGRCLVAAAIVVKVTSDCWYLFYPAHSKRFDRESPLVLLISELYRHAGQQGVKILDLGTSDVGEIAKEGLLAFKKRLGGIPTMKSVYRGSVKQIVRS